MLNVFCKMHLTRQKLTLKYQKEVDTLINILHITRVKCQKIAINYPREALPVEMWLSVWCEFMPQVDPCLREIGKDKRITSFKDPFDLWGIFHLLEGFINNRPDLMIKAKHKFPIESYPQEVRVLLERIDIDIVA